MVLSLFMSAMLTAPERLVFMGFDLLHFDGADLRPRPLIDRRKRLQDLVGCHDPLCRIQYGEHVIRGGPAMFEAADRMGPEGVVRRGPTAAIGADARDPGSR
jgi:ATP-dependent DNA ligase